MFRSLSREVDEDVRLPALAPHRLAAARTFYVEVLRGTLVRAARRHGDRVHLLFDIDDVLVETGPGTNVGVPVLLHVDDPPPIAERCWDAGFSVRVLERPFGDAIVTVIDPFGRQIQLVHATRHRHADASGA